MINFKIENPTVVHFGKDVTNDLGKVVSKYGKKVLLMYGKGSIKSNGIYDKVMGQLNEISADVVEYSGIKPNPIVEDANEAVELGVKENVDVIVAVGGGSVIDTAKIVSITIPLETSAWRVMIKMAKPEKAIPVICVLTLAATGTEMNPYAVLQSDQAKKKLNRNFHNALKPGGILFIGATETMLDADEMGFQRLHACFYRKPAAEAQHKTRVMAAATASR